MHEFERQHFTFYSAVEADNMHAVAGAHDVGANLAGLQRQQRCFEFGRGITARNLP